MNPEEPIIQSKFESKGCEYDGKKYSHLSVRCGDQGCVECNDGEWKPTQRQESQVPEEGISDKDIRQQHRWEELK